MPLLRSVNTDLNVTLALAAVAVVVVANPSMSYEQVRGLMSLTSKSSASVVLLLVESLWTESVAGDEKSSTVGATVSTVTVSGKRISVVSFPAMSLV